MPLYDPKEDSEFLATFVKDHARGHVLDMGTGSGILALAALENKDVLDVVAADLDKDAVDAATAARERLAEKKHLFRVVHSDMFTELGEEKYDTIICNPPYLPDEEKDQHPALYGGEHGWEWTLKFLRECMHHLHPGGQVLTLCSSLANPDLVVKEAKAMGYHVQVLGEMAMFFERLIAYRMVLDERGTP